MGGCGCRWPITQGIRFLARRLKRSCWPPKLARDCDLVGAPSCSANAEPVEAEFRLDAGFGTYANVALLIEMGYDLYTKPHSHQIVTYLKGLVDDTTAWTPVGANAELVAWSKLQLTNCPYPLDVALERFYTGKALKQSALFHFGSHPVTEHLSGWFQQYNGRQTIEAGIKESKQVFYLHHHKVRCEPAIALQEAFVLFAANFIRWAARLFASPGATGRKRAQRAQAGRQTPGACLGASHPGFRRQVLTVH